MRIKRATELTQGFYWGRFTKDGRKGEPRVFQVFDNGGQLRIIDDEKDSYELDSSWLVNFEFIGPILAPDFDQSSDAALPAVPEDWRAELLADDIEAFHKAMDNLGFVPRTCDNGRHLSMYGRAMVGMTKFATMQREAAINSAAELVRSIPASAPQPNRPANAATPAHDQPEGSDNG